jgi:hypothetical protein
MWWSPNLLVHHNLSLMHFYFDSEGRRQSNHLVKDYRTSQRMLQVFGRAHQGKGLLGCLGRLLSMHPLHHHCLHRIQY